MKPTRLATLAILLFASSVLAADKPNAKWLTDFAKAKDQAKSEEKKIYLLFTGSNWCPPCMQLDRQVHRTEEFTEYAEKNLVLLKADFPRPNNLPAAQQKANDSLAEQFNIEFFPTIVVLDQTGKELGRSGYDGSKPKQWLEQVGKAFKE
jgi:thioredoxin-related protein